MQDSHGNDTADLYESDNNQLSERHHLAVTNENSLQTFE